MMSSVGRPSKKELKIRKIKKLLFPFIFSIIFIIFICGMGIINISKLTGNSTYNNIELDVGQIYTTLENDVSICQSQDSSVLSTKIKDAKCTLIPKKVGDTNVEIFYDDNGIAETAYHVKVNTDIKIQKRTYISSKSVLFKLVGNQINDSNIYFSYCLISKNGVCTKISYKDSNKYVNINTDTKIAKFNNIDKNIEKVCLYAYDRNNRLKASDCSERGLFNLFW